MVALDKNNNAVYTTEVKSYGINAAFFKKYRTRNVTWTTEIPEEYLVKTEKISVMQIHNPTYRVANWIKANKDLIISHARSIAEIVKSIKNNEFTAEDAMEIVDSHLK